MRNIYAEIKAKQYQSAHHNEHKEVSYFTLFILVCGLTYILLGV